MSRSVCGATALILWASCVTACGLFPEKNGPDGGGGKDLSVAADLLTHDLALPPDLMPPPDLVPPVDLMPQCLTQSGCQGGLACVNQLCVPCAKHSDCNESQVCDVYLPAAGPGAGRCVPQASLVYVNNTATCPGDGSKATPFCTLSAGLGKVDGVTVTGVAVAASAKDYGVITASSVPAMVYGPAGGDTGSQIATVGSGAAGDAVTLTSGTSITLDGLVLQNGKANGINASVGPATVTVRRSTISGFAKLAVRAVGCTVNMDRVMVTGNVSGALSLGTSSQYSITNSFIVKNGILDNGAAIVMNSASSGSFRYNTVANNIDSTASGGESALTCGSATAKIEDSIFVGNSPTTLGNGMTTQFNLTNGCALTNVVVGTGDPVANGIAQTPTFVSATNFSLSDTAATEACCVNKGLTPNAVDFFGTPRVTTPDIGAFELK